MARYASKPSKLKGKKMTVILDKEITNTSVGERLMNSPGQHLNMVELAEVYAHTLVSFGREHVRTNLARSAIEERVVDLKLKNLVTTHCKTCRCGDDDYNYKYD